MDGGGVGYQVERGRDVQSPELLRRLVHDAVEEMELNDVEEGRVLRDGRHDVRPEEEALVRREVVVDGDAGLVAESLHDSVREQDVHVGGVVEKRQTNLKEVHLLERERPDYLTY